MKTIQYSYENVMETMRMIVDKEMIGRKKTISPVIYFHKEMMDIAFIDKMRDFAETKKQFESQGLFLRKSEAKKATNEVVIGSKTYSIKWFIFTYPEDSPKWNDANTHISQDRYLFMIGNMMLDCYAYFQLTEKK